MDDAARRQLADQCRAVAHLATAVAQITSDYQRMLEKPGSDFFDGIEDMVGKRTAAWMEMLGNMLNAVDAVEEEDDWMEPVFREAQRRWPVDPTHPTGIRGEQ